MDPVGLGLSAGPPHGLQQQVVEPEVFELTQPLLGVDAGESQEALDDLPEPRHLFRHVAHEARQLIGAALLELQAPRLGEEHGDRRLELVAHVGDEALLGLVPRLDPIQSAVELEARLVDLHPDLRHLDPRRLDALGGHGAGGLRDPPQGLEGDTTDHPGGEDSADERGEGADPHQADQPVVVRARGVEEAPLVQDDDPAHDRGQDGAEADPEPDGELRPQREPHGRGGGEHLLAGHLSRWRRQTGSPFRPPYGSASARRACRACVAGWKCRHRRRCSTARSSCPTRAR